MSELPYRLAKGKHKVIYRPIRDDTWRELKAAIDREYVHVKFTEIRGGTELGFPLDEERSARSKADWEGGKGSAHLEGELNLDGVPVHCVANIDLKTVERKGNLAILEEEGDEKEEKATYTAAIESAATPDAAAELSAFAQRVEREA